MPLKLQTDCLKSILDEVAQLKQPTDKITFVYGNFNVIHPGHLRILNFAANCGDILIVGVYKDQNQGVFIAEDLRLAGVKAIKIINYAFMMPGSEMDVIAALKPHIVVKGKEYEERFNPEQSLIDGYGGTLLFCSGEAQFSSIDILQEEIHKFNLPAIRTPVDFLTRHRIDKKNLVNLISQFSRLRVIVVGDLIIDQYVTCDPLGMSQEDPTIVVTPIKTDQFLGGAGIVAAHIRKLGAQIKFFSVTGNDQLANFASQKLEEYDINACLIQDETRPTTLKQRYRANGKTLLRVNHLRQHHISKEIVSRLIDELEIALEDCDLLVFSDFNYGCLPQRLVDLVTTRCVERGIKMVADSQSSSQLGDISRFQDMLLITPTEYEIRLAMRNSVSGLTVLAEELSLKARAKYLFVTLGAEGMLIYAAENVYELQTDQLPALNAIPKDVSGAGDSLLAYSSMALVAGASVWESAYLGSVAAACQVGRVGNTPVPSAEVIEELMR